MANVEGIITENISTTIAPGLTAYDTEGKKVGSVDSVDRETGWFVVTSNDLSAKAFYLPFSLITNIDPHDLFLSRSRDELRTNYSNPPARSTVVAETGDDTTAVTSEPSGYDGGPIVVEQARIDKLKKHILTGSHVYTSDMADLGRIKQYDSVTGMMMVESGVFSKRDLLVPVTVVDSVDQDSHDVSLAYSQADVQRMQHLEPVDVVQVEAEVKES
ncbi:MAG TPA: hypothetical protein VF221_07855 [Chloroflexota bacterium]